MGRRLRELRSERGLQQAELARRLEVSPAVSFSPRVSSDLPRGGDR